MITICSRFSTIAKVHKLVCECRVTFSAVSDIELMGVKANVQRTVMVNRSLYWTSDCSVTSVGYACLFTVYSHMLVLISVVL